MRFNAILSITRIINVVECAAIHVQCMYCRLTEKEGGEGADHKDVLIAMWARGGRRDAHRYCCAVVMEWTYRREWIVQTVWKTSSKPSSDLRFSTSEQLSSHSFRSQSHRHQDSLYADWRFESRECVIRIIRVVMLKQNLVNEDCVWLRKCLNSSITLRGWSMGVYSGSSVQPLSRLLTIFWWLTPLCYSSLFKKIWVANHRNLEKLPKFAFLHRNFGSAHSYTQLQKTFLHPRHHRKLFGTAK